MCAFRCILVIDIQIEACDKYTQITSNKTRRRLRRQSTSWNARDCLRTPDFAPMMNGWWSYFIVRNTILLENMSHRVSGMRILIFSSQLHREPLSSVEIADSEAGQSMYLRSRYNSCRLEFGVVSTWQSKKTSTWSASWSVATSSLHNPSASSAKPSQRVLFEA